MSKKINLTQFNRWKDSPDLIDELERCYALIDAIETKLISIYGHPTRSIEGYDAILTEIIYDLIGNTARANGYESASE